MIKIGDVYNIVRDLANKDQKGFVTPAVFNTFAPVAQLNVYNQIFDDLTKAQSLRRSNIDSGRELSSRQHLEEDLSRYIEEVNLSEFLFEDQPLDDDDLEFPSDLTDSAVSARLPRIKKVISMRTDDASRTSIEMIYSAEKVNRILNSNLSSPTEDFPVAFINGDKIQVYPDTVGVSTTILFYRNPRSVGYDGTIDNQNQPVYSFISNTGVENVAASKNFDLPEKYKNEIVLEVSKMIGIRLRDAFISNAINLEETKQQ